MFEVIASSGAWKTIFARRGNFHYIADIQTMKGRNPDGICGGMIVKLIIREFIDCVDLADVVVRYERKKWYLAPDTKRIMDLYEEIKQAYN